jgi:predicted transposase/invertase (TIGR01784 family)
LDFHQPAPKKSSLAETLIMSENKYISPLVDFAFKKIFGTDSGKDLLIAFLNELFRGRKHIVDLEYNKNEHHGDNESEGTAVFDLLCTGDQGEKFIIEVQHTKPVNFKKRGIYYTSRLISEQSPKGQSADWKYNIPEVYLVAVLEKPMDNYEPDNRYLHDVCLCYRDTGEIFYNGLGYTYIDLSNFVKAEDECTTNLELWLHHLKHLHQKKELSKNLEQTIFEKLYRIAEYTNLTKEEKTMYDQDLKRKWDNEIARASAIEEGLEKGIAEGIERGIEQGIERGIEQGIEKGIEQGIEKGKAEGLAEGEHKKALEIAKSLKSMSLSAEDIAKATGLSTQQIEEI